MADKGTSWQAVRAKAQNLRRGVEDLGRQLEAIATNRPEDAWNSVRLLARELEEWTRLADDLPKRLRGALTAMQEEKERQLATFEQRLARELRASGRSVFGETAIFIADGIVHVDTSGLSEGRIYVNEKKVEELTVRSVVEKVGEEVARLQKAVTPATRFLEALWSAYQHEVRDAQKQSGSQVETTAVLFRVAMQRQTSTFRANPQARNFHDYPQESFRAELYALLASDETVFQGHRFRYAAGADTRGAIFMLVPALQRPAHVGRLWFEPAEGQS